MIICILTILTLNLIAFRKAFDYLYVYDDWEITRCACKKPDVGKFKRKNTLDGIETDVFICRKCGREQRKEPKNFWQKLYWHIMGAQYTDYRMAHTIVFIIHNINCILIYLAFGHNTTSFIVAILFAIHPVAMEGSSVWLSGKGYGLGLTCVLLMWWLKALTPLFYVTSFYFAMNAILAPILFIGTPYFFWILLIPLLITIKWESIRKAYRWKYEIVSKARKPIELRNILLFFKTIGYYTQMCIFPTKLGVHATYLSTYGLTKEEDKQWMGIDRYFIMGIGMTILLLWRWDFGIVWFFLFLLQWSNLVTIHMFIAERYCVISLVGILYFLAQIIESIPFPNIQQVTFVVFFIIYWIRMSDHLPLYEDLMKCIEENVRNFPNSVVAWTWKGGIENKLELTDRAMDSWYHAWQIRPWDFRLNNNLAALMARKGKYDEAEKFLDMAAQSPMLAGRESVRDERVARLRAQINAAKHKVTLGRNDPCRCGSGKKYKKCCGRSSA